MALVLLRNTSKGQKHAVASPSVRIVSVLDSSAEKLCFYFIPKKTDFSFNYVEINMTSQFY